MRVDCPDCGASYEVPEAMLSPGRQVRCVRCGRGWAPVDGLDAAIAPGGGRGADRGDPDGSDPDAAGPGTACFDVPGPGAPARAMPSPDMPGPDMPGPGTPDPAPPLAPVPPPQASTPHPLETVPPPFTAAAPFRPDAPDAEPVAAGRGLVPAWIGSLALLAAGVLAVATWPAEIASAWPPAIRLLRALGLSP